VKERSVFRRSIIAESSFQDILIFDSLVTTPILDASGVVFLHALFSIRVVFLIHLFHRKQECFVSHDSSIGYWIRLGNRVSRILGYDSESNYFLVRDQFDRLSLLTRDGSTFHPVSEAQVETMISGPFFEPSIIVKGDTLDKQAVGEWFANRDFVFGRDKRPVAVWSDRSPDFIR